MKSYGVRVGMALVIVTSMVVNGAYAQQAPANIP